MGKQNSGRTNPRSTGSKKGISRAPPVFRATRPSFGTNIEREGLRGIIVPPVELIPAHARFQLERLFREPLTKENFRFRLWEGEKIVDLIEEIGVTYEHVKHMQNYPTALREYLSLGKLWFKIPKKERKKLRSWLVLTLASARKYSQVEDWLRAELIKRKNSKKTN